MVRRILALLLIGAWQLQGAVPPHFHAGMSTRDLIAHGERVHFHWPLAHHGHAHHHARRAHDTAHVHRHLPRGDHRCAGFGGPLCGHDEDAFYVGTGSQADVTKDSPHLAPFDVTMLAASGGDVTLSLEQHTSAPPRYGGQVPVFLKTTRLLL